MTKTHLTAAREQKDFSLAATLNVLGSCWKKDGGQGTRFFELVLSKSPRTVGECIDWGAALPEPIKAREVQAHLKWAYTSATFCLEINGQRYGADKPAEPVPPTAKAKKAKKIADKPAEAKAKKSKKVKAEPTGQSAT
jgi:hypothetical protein